MESMATTGKGKKKVNKKTVPLALFVAEDQSAPQGFNVVHTSKPKLDWAAEADDLDFLDDKFTLNYKKDNNKVLLPTAPKASRGPDIDMTRVPSSPPYKAYLGNLPYDVSQEEITRYFGKLSIKDVRLPLYNGRQRGFAYAEFDDKESLIEALAKNGDMFRNRQLKVGLPGDNADGSSREGRPEREERADRTAGDWRTAPREEPSDSPRDTPRESNRDNYGFRNGMSNDSYSDRRRNDYSDRSDRSSFGRNFGSDDRSSGFRPAGDRERHFEPYEDRSNSSNDRFGRFNRDDRDSDRSNNRYGNRNDRSDGYNDRESSDRSYGRRYDESNRYSENTRNDNRRDFGRNRNEYEPRNTSPPPNRDRESSDDPPRPSERPKLQLKPRTIPINENNDTVANSAIFGGAKPVDTAAKELAIEKKLLREREESEKKLDGGEGRTRRISSGSNHSGNSRSRKGSDSGPREGDDFRGSGRRPRKTSERSDKSASNESGPKYTLMTRGTGSRDGNDSRPANRFSNSREGDQRDQRSYDRGNGNGGPNRNNFNNSNRPKDRDRDGREGHDSYDRPPRMNQSSEDEEQQRKPQAYITSNKFAHLNNEDYDEEEAASHPTVD